MKKYVGFIVACCLALPAAAFDPLGAYHLSAPAGCIDADITGQELSLPDLIQIGICTNPSLSAQYMGVKATEAALGASRSQYLPSVTLTGSANIAGSRIEGGNWTQQEPYSGRAEASWLLFDFGGRGARIDVTKAYMQAAGYQYNAALQELVLAVQSAYLNLLAAQESLTSANASLETYKHSYNEAQKRYKLGMVSLSDKLQARTQYEQALLAVVQAENRVKQYGGSLAVLLNMPPDTPIQLAKPVYDTKFIQIENDNVQELMKLAQQQRPEMLAQRSSVDAARANVWSTKTDMLPRISALASASYNDNWKYSRPYGAETAAGLLVTMPLFTGFSNTYAVQKANYEYRQTLRQSQGLVLQIQNEVWQAYQNYKTAYRSYEISQTVLESAEENERVAFRYYEVGKGDIINLLTAVAQLADARQNKITAFYNLLLSKANLYRSVGK